MTSYFSSLNKNFIKTLYGVETEECNGYLIGHYMDNLHLDFLKQHNFVPKNTVTCVNSMDLYKLV